jgi:hypothetical protein
MDNLIQNSISNKTSSANTSKNLQALQEGLNNFYGTKASAYQFRSAYNDDVIEVPKEEVFKNKFAI